jgi:photosystem II stability/assembly factor-like uncharacterized protein
LGLLSALALGLLLVTLVPAAAPVPLTPREQQIADLERQINELSRKLAALKAAPPAAPATPELSLPEDWVKGLSWRCIGPAAMGGRIVALSVFEADPTTWWVATASGGLLKTSNNGVTFEHQFDRQSTVSIGDVCVAPSDRNIVWVGTGENNPRNSVSYGDGVYKSTDGGKTWKNMGLSKTFQIGRIVVHPKNPDIVYVGALGRLYGPSEERGLYRTTDGGKSWKQILHVDNKTGVIELKLNPADPETFLVATWERQRDGFDSHAAALSGRGVPSTQLDPPMPDGYDGYDPVKKWGPGSAIYKTTNGGNTFNKLTSGLPTGQLGRIGIDFSRRNPNVVYAIIDSEKIGMGPIPGYLGITGENAPGEGGARITEVTADSPASKSGLKAGDVITVMANKPIRTWEQMVEAIGEHRAEDKIALTLTRAGKPIAIAVTLEARPEGPARRPQEFAPVTGRDELVVGSIVAGSSLDKAGLKTDDVIVSLDKAKMTQWQQVLEEMNKRKPGDRYGLEVKRGKDVLSLTVVVPPAPPRRLNTRPYAFMYGGQRENVMKIQGAEGFQYGGVYRSADGGETWTRINSVNPRPMYFSQIRVDPGDDNHIYVLGIRMYVSSDGGKTFRTGGDSNVHPDQHALWIDPRDGRHMIIGTDGGFYASYDRGAHWDFLNTTAIGQFYHVCVDNRKPYRVYGGLQDNGSWGGPSRALDGRGPVNADWVMVHGGDGFVCRVDPVDPDIVYAEHQDGNLFRRNLRTGEMVSIKPRNPMGQPPHRYNWNTPFIVSAHNPSIVYAAGNVVFRSLKRGDDFRAISPELCKNGRASATALAESPKNPDVLWAGTDDGNLWLSRDGGSTWHNLIERVKLPKAFCVATIEPSRFVEGRVYVTFDGHRSDDDEPHVYVSENFGQSWKPLRGNLPVGSSRVCREDLFNEDVLYLGTEFAVWASVDRGASWTKINANLPTVAVHEFAQHPTAGDLVAATHGRSLWVVDVTYLRQMKAATRKEAVTLFQPNTAVRWRREPQRGTVYGSGHRDYFGQNPAPGGQIYYALAKKAGKIQLAVQDVAGRTLVKLQASPEPGLHRVTWDLRGPAGPPPAGLMILLPRAAGPVPAGQYRVVLSVDGTDYAQGLTVENDPTLPPGTTIAEEPEKPRAREEPRDR